MLPSILCPCPYKPLPKFVRKSIKMDSISSVNSTEVDEWTRDSELEILYTNKRYGGSKGMMSRKYGDNKRPNGIWKEKVLLYHDHHKCPSEINRCKDGGSVLDGIRQQLRDGPSKVEVLACLGSALNDFLSIIQVTIISMSNLMHLPTKKSKIRDDIILGETTMNCSKIILRKE